MINMRPLFRSRPALALALGLGLFLVYSNRTIRPDPSPSAPVPARPALAVRPALVVPAAAVPTVTEVAMPVVAADLETRQAQMRNWASRDPRAALAWLVSRDVEEQGGLAEAAWRGAATNPGIALERAREILIKFPAVAELHGGWLVTVLSEQGETALVLNFAETAPMPGRRDWTCAALGELAGRDPLQALTLWKALPDGSDKGAAWESLASAWAVRDPASLCRHAATLPADAPERGAALFDAAARWCESDPQGYQRWLDTVNLPEEENSPAAAATPERKAAMQRISEEALADLPETVDSAERTLLLGTILEEWAAVDPDAARTWISRAKWRNPEERAGHMRATYQLPRPRRASDR